MNDRVSRLVELAEAATPQPWEWSGNEIDGPEYAEVLTVEDYPPHTYSELQTGVLKISDEDKTLIVAAVNEIVPLARDWEAKDAALRAYAAVYPCPGFEIEPGRTSGCDGSGGDCPTCAALVVVPEEK